jgi:hypothetical protein
MTSKNSEPTVEEIKPTVESKLKQFVVLESQERETPIVYSVLHAQSKDDVLVYLIKNWERFVQKDDYEYYNEDSSPKYEDLTKISSLPLDEIKRDHPSLIRYLRDTYDIQESGVAGEN